MPERIDIANDIIALRKQCPLSGPSLLGDMLQPKDVGQGFVVGDYYPWYWTVARHFQPRTIAEIGVRFGYSLRSMILGTGRAFGEIGVHGWDAECYERNSMEIASRHLSEMNLGSLSLSVANSQVMKSLDVCGIDMFHVDGDHSAAGAVHDMELAFATLSPNGVMLVDDLKFTSVREGILRFCEARSDLDYIDLPTLQGMRVIMNKP